MTNKRELEFLKLTVESTKNKILYENPKHHHNHNNNNNNNYNNHDDNDNYHDKEKKYNVCFI